MILAIIIGLSLIYFIFLIKVLISLKNIDSRKNINNNCDEFITIIIPFKNESENILNNLKSIEDLNYDIEKYEVIYVDDNSEDDSYLKLKNHIRSQNIKILRNPNKKQFGKKKAVKYAIENCKGEIIITTDADCIVQKNWLRKTVSLFDLDTAFISGIVKFNDQGGVWNRIQQLEFGGLVLVGGGLINAGFPTICNAANLAFRKSVFIEVGGFEDNLHITSGDDELLMQKIARNTKYKIKFLFDKESLVSTSPNTSFKAFYNQRVRWASKGLHYKNPLLIIFLISIYLFFISFPIQIVLGFLYNKLYLISSFIIFSVKLVLERKILLYGYKVLFKNMNFFLFIIAEILHIPYIIIAGVMGTVGKFKWKEIEHKR